MNPVNYKKTILVTGSNGQLGNELQKLAEQYSSNFLFTTKANLAIENKEAVIEFFKDHHVDYCINCAAYTAVDKAESEQEKAFLINGDAVGILAKTCGDFNARFIHISTDYVFNGTASIPYTEEYNTDPINMYGASKLKGEELALSNLPSVTIIRTSWVYSSFGNNFVKTMLRLMNEKESINVVSDQQGSPTYAADLAEAILKIINIEEKDGYKNHEGIFNFCNAGTTTWYEFALAIKNYTNSKCIINPILTSQYTTAAKRPQYSVLDTSKIKNITRISISDWRDSLNRCLSILV